jgi:hypothetical protein
MAYSRTMSRRDFAMSAPTTADRVLSGVHLLSIALVWLVLFIPMGVFSLVCFGVSRLFGRSTSPAGARP